MLAFAILGAALAALAQAPRHSVTVVSETGIERIPVSEFSKVPMIPLAALAELVGAELRPGAEQAVFFSANDNIARLTDGKEFVSVKKDLVLLSSPPRKVTGQWFVPIDFITKVLPAFTKESLSYRDSERMLVVGDSFPTLEVRSTRDPSYTRVEVSTNRAVPIEIVAQTSKEVRLAIQTPYLKTAFEEEEVLDEVVERIALSRTEQNYELSVTLGERFWTLQTTNRDSPDHAVVLDFLRSRIPTRPTSSSRSETVEEIPEDLRPVEERRKPESPEGENPPLPVEDVVLLPESTSPRSAEDILSRNSGPTRLQMVAIDPGHGGGEVGAEGRNGLVEKDLALSIARRLRELLLERLGVQVVLTRDGDRNLGLDERTAVANNNKADVFISIHADASPSREATGSSVYFLSYSSSGAEGEVSSARGRSGSMNESLDFILWDMAQASHLNQSARLAEILQQELLSATGASENRNRGIKQNTFRVLRGATMPAVLVEVGFISNPGEAELLKTREHQERIAEALYRGVLEFKKVYEYEPRAGSGSSPGPPLNK